MKKTMSYHTRTPTQTNLYFTRPMTALREITSYRESNSSGIIWLARQQVEKYKDFHKIIQVTAKLSNSFLNSSFITEAAKMVSFPVLY